VSFHTAPFKTETPILDIKSDIVTDLSDAMKMLRPCTSIKSKEQQNQTTITLQSAQLDN